MVIHYFLFEVAPSPDSENFEDSGGAFICCWIKSPKAAATDAEKIAKKYIKSEGWEVISLDEYKLPQRDWYKDISDSLEQFDNAVKYGEAYITHSWPPEPQEGDEIH